MINRRDEYGQRRGLETCDSDHWEGGRISNLRLSGRSAPAAGPLIHRAVSRFDGCVEIDGTHITQRRGAELRNTLPGTAASTAGRRVQLSYER